MQIAIVLVVVAALVIAVLSIRVFRQYERGVQFRLGKLKDGPRGPGLVLIIPVIDRIQRVSLRIVTMPIQSQGIITKDNVSVDISAVAYYRVDDPDPLRGRDRGRPRPRSTRSPRRPCARSSASTPWTRRCPRPSGSTRTSARSSTSRPRSGASR